MTRQEHLLTALAEECAEVIQAVSKSLRFGLDDHHPDSDIPNAESIAKELSDIAGIQKMLINEGLIRACDPRDVCEKIERVERWLLYSREVGKLTPLSPIFHKDDFEELCE